MVVAVEVLASILSQVDLGTFLHNLGLPTHSILTINITGAWTIYVHIRTCFVSGRWAGSEVGREPKTGQPKVQLYYEDDPLCPSRFIFNLCSHPLYTVQMYNVVFGLKQSGSVVSKQFWSSVVFCSNATVSMSPLVLGKYRL